MKNQTKTAQEFRFTLQPATITSGAHQGETEIHLPNKYVPAQGGGEARVAPASVRTKSGLANALYLYRRDAPIEDTTKLEGLCIVRTAEGFQAGQVTGHHATADGMTMSIAGLKRLGGRPLALARLAEVKSQLAHKYTRLTVKSCSKGRTLVLALKARTFRCAANAHWLKAFNILGKA
jgi:hypothetical protein